MISAARLRAIYESGAIISDLAGLEAVWDAAQTDILMGPAHHHKHPRPVTICVPDPCQPALFAATGHHHHHEHDHHRREHDHAE